MEEAEETNTEEEYHSDDSDDENSDISYDIGEHLEAYPGDQIGKYTLKERIGVGQYGLVWSIEEDPNHVLKIMRSGTEYHEMIESEINILKSISSSDYIVSFCDVFSFSKLKETHRIIVFEKMNRDLFSVLHDREDTIPIDQGKRLIRQLLRGVAALKEEKIVHFDLKPENILVREVDDRVVLKICDFGTAKKIPISNVPEYGKTYEYRSPEVIMDLDCDEKSDIWSAACISYEIITAIYKTSRYLFEPRNIHLVENDAETSTTEIDLNHLYLIQEILGLIPKRIYRHCTKYFTLRGELRGIGAVMLSDITDLMYDDGIREIDTWIGFLGPMLRYNCRKRADAIDMIDHEAINNTK